MEPIPTPATETVPDALCTLLDYLQAPELQDALMLDTMGGTRLATGGYMLRVKGRDVRFVNPSYMWQWDDDPA